MRHDIADILATLGMPQRIMVLGDDERDWQLARTLAGAAAAGEVMLGVTDGRSAEALAEPVGLRMAGRVGAVRVVLSPRSGFWEADRVGSADVLVLRGLEQRPDPLDILVYARSLDMRLLCVEAGLVPASLCTAAGTLPGDGTGRAAARSMTPAACRALAEPLDRIAAARAASNGEAGVPASDLAMRWHWFMTAAGIRDLLRRAGWHAFHAVESASRCSIFFLCRREPDGAAVAHRSDEGRPGA